MESSTGTSFEDDDEAGDLMVGFPSSSQRFARQERRRMTRRISNDTGGSSSLESEEGFDRMDNNEIRAQVPSGDKSKFGFHVYDNGKVVRHNLARRMSFESISSKAESSVNVNVSGTYPMFDTTEMEIPEPSESEYTYITETDDGNESKSSRASTRYDTAKSKISSKSSIKKKNSFQLAKRTSSRSTQSLTTPNSHVSSSRHDVDDRPETSNTAHQPSSQNQEGVTTFSRLSSENIAIQNNHRSLARTDRKSSSSRSTTSNSTHRSTVSKKSVRSTDSRKLPENNKKYKSQAHSTHQSTTSQGQIISSSHNQLTDKQHQRASSSGSISTRSQLSSKSGMSRERISEDISTQNHDIEPLDKSGHRSKTGLSRKSKGSSVSRRGGNKKLSSNRSLHDRSNSSVISSSSSVAASIAKSTTSHLPPTLHAESSIANHLPYKKEVFMGWDEISGTFSEDGSIQSMANSRQSRRSGAEAEPEVELHENFPDKPRGAAKDDNSVTSSTAASINSVQIEEEYDSRRPWRKAPPVLVIEPKNSSDLNSVASTVSEKRLEVINENIEQRLSSTARSPSAYTDNSANGDEISETSDGLQSGSDITELREAKTALTTSQNDFTGISGARVRSLVTVGYDAGHVISEQYSKSLPPMHIRKQEPFLPGPNSSANHRSDRSLASQSVVSDTSTVQISNRFKRPEMKQMNSESTRSSRSDFSNVEASFGGGDENSTKNAISEEIESDSNSAVSEGSGYSYVSGASGISSKASRRSSNDSDTSMQPCVSARPLLSNNARRSSMNGSTLPLVDETKPFVDDDLSTSRHYHAQYSSDSQKQTKQLGKSMKRSEERNIMKELQSAFSADDSLDNKTEEGASGAGENRNQSEERRKKRKKGCCIFRFWRGLF